MVQKHIHSFPKEQKKNTIAGYGCSYRMIRDNYAEIQANLGKFICDFY